MGDFKLSEIKKILSNTTFEIQTVQKELSRDHGTISNQKVEKLTEHLNKSEIALKELKKIQITPTIKSDEIQNIIENILKARASQGHFNPAVLQAILSSLQGLNNEIGEITLKEGDHKRGQRIENIDHEKL